MALPPAVTGPITQPTTLAEASRGGDAGILQQVGREADDALAIGKRILGMLNVESKEVQVAFNTSTDYVGGLYNPLASITQGNTDSNRDGDSLKLKHWKGKLSFTRGTVDSIVAFCFVQEGPSFITTVSQVFESVGTASAPMSQPQWDSRLGFKILHEGCLALTANDPLRIHAFALDFNHDVQYYNNSSTVYEGKVSLYIISDQAAGVNAPTVRLVAQLDWVDN